MKNKGEILCEENLEKQWQLVCRWHFLCASIPAANETHAASNPKLSAGSLSLRVGQSKKLTVKNASGTVKWSSSNKKIVAVAKTTKKAAKVTAKKAGTAQIKAKVDKKVLKCKVTVKKAGQNNNKTTQTPSSDKVLAKLSLSEDGKTVKGVKNRSDATYAVI